MKLHNCIMYCSIIATFKWSWGRRRDHQG